jgi:hypothetical protein
METPDNTEVDEEFQKLLTILDTKDIKYRNKSEKENSHMNIVRKSLETVESIRYTPSRMKLYMNEDQIPDINQVFDDTEQQQQQQQQQPLSSVDSSPIAHTDSFTDLYPDNSLQFDTDSPLLINEENNYFESSTPFQRPFKSIAGIDSRTTPLDKSQSLSSEANEEVNR